MNEKHLAILALGVVGAGCAIAIALSTNSVGVVITLAVALFLCITGILSQIEEK